MNKDTWKGIAIVFIILFIIQTSLWIWATNLVLNDLEKEEQCIINVCGYNYATEQWMDKYDGYSFDEDISTCYCYEEDYISKQEYIK